jgi:hypothetical protein
MSQENVEFVQRIYEQEMFGRDPGRLRRHLRCTGVCLKLLATEPSSSLTGTTCTTSTAVAPREMPYEAEA